VLLAGANVTMLVSALLHHGIDHLRIVEQDLRAWLQDHEYDSIQQLQGSMSQINCPNPQVFERAQYIKSIQTYQASLTQTHQPSRYFG
jgi:dihydroorotate dehydrogenase (fumarate)